MKTTIWVYIKTGHGLWTVGFYSPDGKWHPDTDWGSKEEAAQRVHYLNGGSNEKETINADLLDALKAIKAECFVKHNLEGPEKNVHDILEITGKAIRKAEEQS